MDGDSRILYVPLENRVRELDARLIFSLVAVTANFQVVLGPKWLLSANASRLPQGLYAVKTINKLDANEMRNVTAYGHTPIAWDEEGPGQIVPEIYLKSIDDEAITLAGRIYAWGETQAQALATRFPRAKDKILTLGNPRWDLLKPEYRKYFAPEAAAIRERFGRFILMNTNFSFYNAWLSNARADIATVAHQVGAFREDDHSDQRMLDDIYEFEHRGFDDYVLLLPALSASFPEHTIIVRPHPTENHERWRALVSQYSNVKVAFEGSVVPWMLAAEAVVQNSCTTGVEALTLGRPVISYCKNPSPIQEWHLSNLVCPRVQDEAAAVGRLRAFIADPASFDAPRAIGRAALTKHISQLDGETSSTAIVKSLVHFANEREKQGARFDRKFEMPQGFQPYTQYKYYQLKLPPIPAEEVAKKAGRIAKLHPAILTMQFSHISESCFYFRR